MTAAFTAAAVIERACLSRDVYRTASDARRAAREHTEIVKPYRCPFVGRRRKAHWHIGPAFTLPELQEIARVIRELA